MKQMLLLGLILAAPASADESEVKLKEGEGKQIVEASCSMCHSLDYIQINSIFLDRKGWEASVNKMIKVMGAPIPSADVPAIVNYLSRNYGK